MTAPTATQPRAREARWRLLLAGVLTATLTAALLLYLARFDGVRAFRDVAPGQVGVSAGGAWRLQSLQRRDALDNRWGDEDLPVGGATFVVATLEADLVGADEDALCNFTLLAGELVIRADTSAGMESPYSVCRERGTAPVTVVFEVPISELTAVRAVSVETGGGPVLRLAGSLG